MFYLWFTILLLLRILIVLFVWRVVDLPINSSVAVILLCRPHSTLPLGRDSRQALPAAATGVPIQGRPDIVVLSKVGFRKPTKNDNPLLRAILTP